MLVGRIDFWIFGKYGSWPVFPPRDILSCKTLDCISGPRESLASRDVCNLFVVYSAFQVACLRINKMVNIT